MSPPSFEKIGSQVEEFVNEDVYWNSPNMKISVTSRDNTGLSASLFAYPPSYNVGPFYPFNNYCRTAIDSKLFIPLFKDTELTFMFLQPASFGTKLTFPLFMTPIHQELYAALSNSYARKSANFLFKEPGLRSRSSYSSDNMVVDLVTEFRGKKVKSYLSLVLCNDNFLVGPRLGVSLKKPSHWYFDLKLGYTSKNVEAFSFFSFKRLHSLQHFSYGVLRRHPRFDVGLFSSFSRTSQDRSWLTVAMCYKPNSWSFLKFVLTQDKLFAWNYGFTLTDGVLTTVGFSTDLGSGGNCMKFNASVNIVA